MAQGQLSEPWKARREFAFLFAFPNCACGFPGAAAGSGFHGRFCADLENRGRHKEATMELPLTRIKGGRRGGPGAVQPVLPSTGGPPGQGERVAGGRCAGTPAVPAVGTCHVEGAVESPPLSRGSSCSTLSEVVQELDPDVPPVLISCCFQPAFHPAGCVAFSFQLPSPFRDRLARCCAHPAAVLAPGNRRTARTESWETWSPHHCCKPSAAEQR